VAPQGSLLALRRTGPAETDYRLVSTAYPGHGSNIRDLQIEGGLVYLGAGNQGLVA